MEVLEGLDGRLSVQHEGCIVASREAPPRPGILRSFGSNRPVGGGEMWAESEGTQSP